MARSFSNAKRLSSFFGDQFSVVISKRGLATAPHGAAAASADAVMKKGSEESLKSLPRVSEFRSNQVSSFLNQIRPFSTQGGNVYKSQIPSMLSVLSKFSTSASPSVASPTASHARPLSPHLSIYKPQSNSMYSIVSRIAAIYISGVSLLFYFLYMKTGLVCFTYNGFYQLFFGVNGFTDLICYTSVPLLLLHIIHSVKH